MKFTKLAATLLCSTLLLCGCVKNSDVVLKVNDAEITRGEFYGDFNKIKKLQLAQAPKEEQKDTSYTVLILKDRFVNDTIVRELLKQEFEKRKIEATEEEIKAKKDDIISKIGSEEQFQKILKENGISKERLNSDMANEVKIDKLVEIVAPVKVSDKDVADFYNQNKEQFKTPETVHAYHILIKTDKDEIKRQIVEADKDAKLSSANIDEKVNAEIQRKEQLLKDIQAKLNKNPKDFEKLAKEYSEDASAEKGGDLGQITRLTVVKEFGDQAFTQKVGTISPVVKSQFGSHIIYVKDKKPEGTRTLSEVKDELKPFLTQQAKIEGFRKYIEGLRKEAKVEYVDESLNPETLKKQIEEALLKQSEALNKKEDSKEEKEETKK